MRIGSCYISRGDQSPCRLQPRAAWRCRTARTAAARPVRHGRARPLPPRPPFSAAGGRARGPWQRRGGSSSSSSWRERSRRQRWAAGPPCCEGRLCPAPPGETAPPAPPPPAPSPVPLPRAAVWRGAGRALPNPGAVARGSAGMHTQHWGGSIPTKSAGKGGVWRRPAAPSPCPGAGSSASARGARWAGTRRAGGSRGPGAAAKAELQGLGLCVTETSQHLNCAFPYSETYPSSLDLFNWVLGRYRSQSVYWILSAKFSPRTLNECLITIFGKKKCARIMEPALRFEHQCVFLQNWC